MKFFIPVGQEAEIGTPEGLDPGTDTAEVDMVEILEMSKYKMINK